MDERVQSFRQWLEEVAQWDGTIFTEFARLVVTVNDPTFPVYPMDFGEVREYLKRRGEYDRQMAKQGPDAWRTWLDDIRRAHPLIPLVVAAYHRLAALNDPADADLLDQLRLALQVRRVDVEDTENESKLPPLGDW